MHQEHSFFLLNYLLYYFSYFQLSLTFLVTMAKQHVNHVILEATTDEEILALYPVYKELRPHVPSASELLEQAKIQMKEGVRYLYIKDTVEGEKEPRPVSILSYRILHCFYYYKQMYVHDVVTLSAAKKKGYAGALLDRSIEIAKKEKCNVSTLDSGYTRNDAHRLYMNKRFYTKAHHFCLDIDPVDKRK